MRKVLLIEDESAIADAITEQLTDRGFTVEWSSNGIEGLAKARTRQPDIVIIDRMLPDMNGIVVIEALRKGPTRIPVLVLSALDRVEERVRGLSVGGDDYLAKPFAAAELLARIEALLRRPPQTNEVILRVGPLELNRIERTAKRGSRKIELAPRQFRLLEYMMRRRVACCLGKYGAKAQALFSTREARSLCWGATLVANWCVISRAVLRSSRWRARPRRRRARSSRTSEACRAQPRNPLRRSRGSAPLLAAFRRLRARSRAQSNSRMSQPRRSPATCKKLHWGHTRPPPTSVK